MTLRKSPWQGPERVCHSSQKHSVCTPATVFTLVPAPRAWGLPVRVASEQSATYENELNRKEAHAQSKRIH